MMKTVTVRGVEIGAGIPKICVPIVGTTREEILSQAQALPSLPVDVVEWRCDWYQNIFDRSAVTALLPDLRNALGNLPLLITFRTKQEGGEREITPQQYTALLTAAIESGCVDLVDAELFLGDEIFKTICTEAHRHEVAVIASNHDFHKTPTKEEILARLTHMEELGADIAKIAVMPTDTLDVLTLLEATARRYQEANIPLITMSMSGTGVVSRLAGEVFGSALTFGAAGKASAPGQIGVEDLAQILRLLHNGK